MQEQEQQLHEKRIGQLSVCQDSAQVPQQGDAFRASSTSLQSLASQPSMTGSFRKRPDTAYEGRLAASAGGLQSSAAGSFRSSYADSDTGSLDFPLASQSDMSQAVCAQVTKKALSVVMSECLNCAPQESKAVSPPQQGNNHQPRETAKSSQAPSPVNCHSMHGYERVSMSV